MRKNTSEKHSNHGEDELYRKSIEMIRTNINNGVKFDLACGFINAEDKELRQMIIDDALKIEIAELHYGKRMPLSDVSKRLGVPMKRLLEADHEMMEDIAHTAEKFSEEQAGGSGAVTH